MLEFTSQVVPFAPPKLQSAPLAPLVLPEVLPDVVPVAVAEVLPVVVVVPPATEVQRFWVVSQVPVQQSRFDMHETSML